MTQRRIFQIYTLIWSGAVIVLLILLWQINGDVKSVNYSGVIRGATQEVVKEELYNNQDDERIDYIDSVLTELQTGEGPYGIILNNDEEYQQQLSEIQELWEELKEAIYGYREGEDKESLIYELSETHYSLSDEMVSYIENHSHMETSRFIYIFCFSMVLCITVFLAFYLYSKKNLDKSYAVHKLTNLRNRIGFEEAAEKLIRKDPNKKYTIIKFDIVNFKLINETYDYDLGDQLLCQIAKCLKSLECSECVTAHIEADNFIVIGEHSPDMVKNLEEHLIECLKDVDLSRLFNEVKFIYGAYTIWDNWGGIKTIISKVALAHKIAKSEQATSVVWYSEKLLQRLEQENRYAEHIEQAIQNHEFKMYLQPQVDLHNMSITSAESLVRWQLPKGEFLYPDTFIPLFERKGIIDQLDYYMLEQVCTYLNQRIRNREKRFVIAVNISRVTLSKRKFAEKFVAIVDRYEIPHEYIEIEVTESSLNHLSESVIAVLEELKDDGFKLAMDDFGAGYSSLNSLSSLPVQVLKLDRQFLWGIDNNEKMGLIITSIVNLAHSMGLSVICEGVEKQNHVDFLKSIGCEYAQGYYFAKPMPWEEFTL